MSERKKYTPTLPNLKSDLFKILIIKYNHKISSTSHKIVSKINHLMSNLLKKKMAGRDAPPVFFEYIKSTSKGLIALNIYKREIHL